jgi:hypothetical protein
MMYDDYKTGQELVKKEKAGTQKSRNTEMHREP